MKIIKTSAKIFYTKEEDGDKKNKTKTYSNLNPNLEKEDFIKFVSLLSIFENFQVSNFIRLDESSI